MAQVPYSEGVQTVEPRGAPPEDYQRITATPQMFGGEIASGLEKAGAGATAAGKFFGQVAADQAFNQYQDFADKLYHGDPTKVVGTGPDGQPQYDTGFKGLQGEAALKARPAVEQQLDQKLSEIRDGLQTPDQEFLFDQYSRRYRSVIRSQIGDHADQQTNAYYTQVENDAAKVARNHISNNAENDEIANNGISELINARLKSAQRYGAQPGDQFWDSTLGAARAEGEELRIDTLAAKNPAAATALAEKRRDILGERYAPLVQRLQARTDQQIGNQTGDAAFTQADANHPYRNPALPIWRDVSTAVPGGFTPSGIAKTVQIESGGNPNAVNGHAVGLGQFMPTTWAQYGQGDRRDPTQAVLATQRYAAANAPILAATLGRDPTDAELYLAHQQGAGGASALLSHPDARAGDLVGDAAIRNNGGDPNGPAWAFTNMWIGRFNGAAGASMPSGIGTVGAFPVSPMGRKANAYQLIMDDPNLNDVQKDHAITRVNRLEAMQNIAEANTDKQNKAQVNAAEGEYFAAARQGQVTPELMLKLDADPRFASDETKRKDVYNYIATTAGGKKSLIDFGSGWLSFKDRILSDPGTPGHIADSREIMRATLPGGPLTPAGGDDLLKLYTEVRKDLNDEQKMALHDNKATVEKEAYKLLTFESPEMEMAKIKDPKGQTIFGKWRMQFNADYSREAAGGQTNMFEWLKTQMDGLPKVTTGLRSEAQKAMDRISAVGEAAGEKIEPIIPPPLPGIEQAPWAEVMSVRPILHSGAPLPPQNWAEAIRRLRNNPSEEVKAAFKDNFPGPDFDPDTIMKKLGSTKATEAAPGGESKDYDYAGAQAAGVRADERGHLPDTYKLPNHITFSDESKYSNAEHQGGHWRQVEGNHWEFTPGPENLKHHSIQELRDYFKKYEPESKLVAPAARQTLPEEAKEGMTQAERMATEARERQEALAQTAAERRQATIQ